MSKSAIGDVIASRHIQRLQICQMLKGIIRDMTASRHILMTANSSNVETRHLFIYLVFCNPSRYI